jgi:hypothetical protein
VATAAAFLRFFMAGWAALMVVGFLTEVRPPPRLVSATPRHPAARFLLSCRRHAVRRVPPRQRTTRCGKEAA